jgi:predicted HNH restriction endonuclease
MPRYFSHYWPNDIIKKYKEWEGQPLDHTASNEFRTRGVKAGDLIYLVTNLKGQLHVLARMEVAKICGPEEAAAALNDDPRELWNATDHIIASSSTAMKSDLRIPSEVTKTLLFLEGSQTVGPSFKYPNYLDNQTLQGVRELTAQSAAQLDKFLPVLEQDTKEAVLVEIPFALPEELSEVESYPEAAKKPIYVNAFEHNTIARSKCLQHYGFSCSVCDFNFEAAYGEIGRNYIHIHHLVPLSEIDDSYLLDSIEDLRPICPNCHGMIHQKQPAYTIAEIKGLLGK